MSKRNHVYHFADNFPVTIYLIKGPGGKKYVGRTIQSVQTRFKAHKSSKHSLLGRAIDKYGEGVFSIEILAENLSKKQADWEEPYQIIKNNAVAPNGYNLHVPFPFEDRERFLNERCGEFI